MIDIGRVLTAEEVAEWLNVEVVTIRKWTSAKKIPFVKLSSRAVRYPERLIVKWIAEKIHGADPEEPDIMARRQRTRETRSPTGRVDVEKIIESVKIDILGKQRRTRA